jgi:S1-C subfamily serine protease
VPAWSPPGNNQYPAGEYADDDDDEDGAGVEIAGIGAEGPLAAAGIQEGDVIVAVDGTPVGTESDLMSALGGLMPGRSAVLEVVRGDTHLTTVVVAPS